MAFGHQPGTIVERITTDSFRGLGAGKEKPSGSTAARVLMALASAALVTAASGCKAKGDMLSCTFVPHIGCQKKGLTNYSLSIKY